MKLNEAKIPINLTRDSIRIHYILTPGIKGQALNVSYIT